MNFKVRSGKIIRRQEEAVSNIQGLLNVWTPDISFNTFRAVVNSMFGCGSHVTKFLMWYWSGQIWPILKFCKIRPCCDSVIELSATPIYCLNLLTIIDNAMICMPSFVCQYLQPNLLLESWIIKFILGHSFSLFYKTRKIFVWIHRPLSVAKRPGTIRHSLLHWTRSY